MGLSEQRSLRRVDTEREREREMERQRERERRRERARGGGTGVVRASSLAEDRERELEGEAGRSGTSSERSGTSLESNEREDCRMGREDGVNMEKRPDEEREDGTMEQDSGMIEDIEERVRNGEGSSVSMDGVMEAKEVGEGYGVDVGREANKDPEGCYSYPDNLQQTRLTLRKNSAPSSQIANAFFSQPLSQEADPVSGASYRAEEMDLNGTYFQKEAYPLDIARERALTISSPFRHSPFSFKPKSLDQNASRPRPLSLLHHPHSNS